LPEQVPALVEFDLERTQPSVLLLCADLVPLQAIAQFALLVDEFVDMSKGIVVRCHGSSVPAVVLGLAVIDA
jgi:hypothetical protein